MPRIQNEEPFNFRPHRYRYDDMGNPLPWYEAQLEFEASRKSCGYCLREFDEADLVWGACPDCVEFNAANPDVEDVAEEDHAPSRAGR